jgi:hypothetical protein
MEPDSKDSAKVRQQFSIEIDRQEVVEEIIARSKRYISIRLVSPYGRLSSNCTIPLFAVGRRFDGEAGDFMARSLLVELYRKAVLFTIHRNEIANLWRLTQQQLLALDSDDDSPQRIADEKRQLKRRMRAGEFDHVEYQRRLRPINDRRDAYDTRRQTIIDAFMESKPWPDDVDLGEVVSFLGLDEVAAVDTDGLPHDTFDED